METNDAGTIVGVANAGSTDGMSYSGGVMTDLGSWGASAGPNGINSAGDMVGGAPIALIDSGGVLTNLNTVLDSSGAGWSLQAATAINDNGEIVGNGLLGGNAHAFLLTPVPEPSSIAMLLCSVGLIAFVRSRRHPARWRNLPGFCARFVLDLAPRETAKG